MSRKRNPNDYLLRLRETKNTPFKTISIKKLRDQVKRIHDIPYTRIFSNENTETMVNKSNAQPEIE